MISPLLDSEISLQLFRQIKPCVRDRGYTDVAAWLPDDLGVLREQAGLH